MDDQSTLGLLRLNLTMAQEHLQMRQIIESVLYRSITPAAFAKKYKDFECDPLVGEYVDNIIEGFGRHGEKEAIRGKVN